MFLRDSAELRLAPAGGSPPRELVLGTGVAPAVVVTIGSFFFVQPLIDVAAAAASVATVLTCCVPRPDPRNRRAHSLSPEARSQAGPQLAPGDQALAAKDLLTRADLGSRGRAGR